MKRILNSLYPATPDNQFAFLAGMLCAIAMLMGVILAKIGGGQ